MSAIDPIVVLGARIEGHHPGPLLQARLDKALEIKAPGQTIIATGNGEARAMADYLRANGCHDIVEEHSATSTNENLENARAIAPHAQKFIIVTSNFHVLRTRAWAWHLGIPAKVIPAPTPKGKRAHNYLREVFATPHSISRIIIRRLLHAIRGH